MKYAYLSNHYLLIYSFIVGGEALANGKFWEIITPNRSVIALRF